MSASEPLEPKSSRRLWIFAAVAALTLHVGGAALAIVHLQATEGYDSLGAQGINVGLVFGSERNEPTDLPPGPESDESAASPALTEQKAVEKETDLPKAKPNESENPDRIVTTHDSQKPKEEEQKVAAVQTNASQESVAQEAAAPVDLGEKGDGIIDAGLLRDKQLAETDWKKKISAYFEAHKVYPKVSKTKEASVIVNLVLDRLGRVVSVDIEKSSGDRLYDDAAIAMIRRSDPVPKPPAKLTDDTFRYTLPVKFNKQK